MDVDAPCRGSHTRTHTHTSKPATQPIAPPLYLPHDTNNTHLCLHHGKKVDLPFLFEMTAVESL